MKGNTLDKGTTVFALSAQLSSAERDVKYGASSPTRSPCDLPLNGIVNVAEVLALAAPLWVYDS